LLRAIFKGRQSRRSRAIPMRLTCAGQVQIPGPQSLTLAKRPPPVKAKLHDQAKAYRKLAAKRAREIGLPLLEVGHGRAAQA